MIKFNGIKVSALAVATVTALSVCSSASASVIGSEVVLSHDYATIGSPTYGSQNVTVEAGAGDVVQPYTSGWYTVDIEADSINIQYFNNPSWSAATFNGVVINGLNWNGASGGLTNAVLTTSIAGFDTSRLTFDTDSVMLNWQGLSFAADSWFQINLHGDDAPSAVPLPASGLLLIAAFGGLANMRRKTKA